ncbi:hypothetical protein BDM02DRAFT_3129978 [Thelephora ganbajun]|uniref:Uncharacterized protein n=1 Tax=Thelephora ganbajun TaxID=370292 RepID=A0ACB6ZBX4_THEGA|nr:hypothetical protein BDM02DRAFT_3129978 [Thelephora ganbajun]
MNAASERWEEQLWYRHVEVMSVISSDRPRSPVSRANLAQSIFEHVNTADNPIRESSKYLQQGEGATFPYRSSGKPLRERECDSKGSALHTQHPTLIPQGFTTRGATVKEKQRTCEGSNSWLGLELKVNVSVVCPLSAMYSSVTTHGFSCPPNFCASTTPMWATDRSPSCVVGFMEFSKPPFVWSSAFPFWELRIPQYIVLLGSESTAISGAYAFRFPIIKEVDPVGSGYFVVFALGCSRYDDQTYRSYASEGGFRPIPDEIGLEPWSVGFVFRDPVDEQREQDPSAEVMPSWYGKEDPSLFLWNI